MDNRSLVLCRSDAGDGGWSLHPPGSTDDTIASGDARVLAAGASERTATGWARPHDVDYRDARLALGPNGSASVGIEIVYGARSVGDDDRQRAAEAAAAWLNYAGVVAKNARATYDAQWSELDDEEQMTGLAVVWIAARDAADMALTEGWADPCGASCSIRA